MTPEDIVQEFWGNTTQGAKLCTFSDLVGLVEQDRAVCHKDLLESLDKSVPVIAAILEEAVVEEREGCEKAAKDLITAFSRDGSIEASVACAAVVMKIRERGKKVADAGDD